VDNRLLPAPLERHTETFSTRTVEVLRDMVLTGKLRTGERFNEVELANALGISRGPLREAIQRLRSEGLATTVTGRGTFVRTFTPRQLEELYEVRIALETHAVRLAASDLDGESTRELHQLLDDTGKLLANDQAYPRDLDFHLQLVALSGNQELVQATVTVLRQIDLARSRSGREPSRAQAALTEHHEIVELLDRGRAEQAAKALVKHLRSSLRSALSVLESDGSAAPDAAGSSR
jgi:DNA-binding GntR family transcriptional regulator